jgi:hypothetical protein
VAFTPPSSIFSGSLVFPPSIDVDVIDRAGRLLGVVSADSLPLPDGAATDATASRAADSLDDVGLTALLERDKIAP